MEQKIVEMLGDMQQQMNRMESNIFELKSDMTMLKGDVSVLKEHEDTFAILERIYDKVEAVVLRQDEADHVIDVLAARAIRLEARRSAH